MKNIFKYTALIVASLLVTISCTDDDATRFPEFATGVSARVFLYPERSFVNFDDLSSASVAFDVYTFSADLQQVVYKVQYLDADQPDANYPVLDAITVPASSFVSGKATELEITAAELAGLFELPGGVTHLSGGDSFVFTAEATLTDGRVFTAANSAPSITGGATPAFTTTFTAYVGCPSPADQIAGTYDAIMVYNNFGIGIDNSVEVEVTFVGPEPFRYRVTDHTAELYVPFGGEQYQADFYDICGTTVLQPATSFGGVTNFVDPGDPDLLPAVIDLTGAQPTFVLNWFEDNNGIVASVRFVKKP
jgi:hypothetical protein